MTRTPQDTETDPDGLIRFGTIASVDLAAKRCTVTIDDDFETPPLRWIAARMGKTRVWSPPSAGEQVVLLCPGGEIAAAVALTGLIGDDFDAPSTEPIDLIQFDDGSKLSYDAEASELVFALAGKLRIEAPDGIEITGDVTVTGKIEASDDVLADGKSLKSHTHGGVQAGGGSTGAPQ
jgi:phage baseplate assembly protein V